MKRKRKRQSKANKKPFRKFVAVVLCLGLAFAGAHYYWGPFTFPWDKATLPGRPVENAAELQIALARLGYSPGSIDGAAGSQTAQALKAFQEKYELPVTGTLDAETREVLRIEEPTHAYLELSASALSKLVPAPASWRERGQLPYFGYHSILEMVAEKSASDPDYIRALNPGFDWNRLRPGDRVLTPFVPSFRIEGDIGRIEISLSQRQLRALSATGELLFHCPVSIARDVAKRPVGRLKVDVRVEDPNYTFNPNILTAAAEREGITQKFIIQPGPNNPVGTVWLGLNRPSYGIHGTPVPEKVGRTESSGCFRLANWNAETLLHAVKVGTEVIVLP